MEDQILEMLSPLIREDEPSHHWLIGYIAAQGQMFHVERMGHRIFCVQDRVEAFDDLVFFA